MSADESFLRRWSRLKQRAAEPKTSEPEPLESDVPPQLPPIENLGFDSDFKAFMHPKVDRGTRSAALKKLFMSPHYQATDGLDVYIGDYSSPEPLPAAMLAGLAHARALLQDDRPEEKPGSAAPAAQTILPADEPQEDQATDVPAPPREQA